MISVRVERLAKEIGPESLDAPNQGQALLFRGGIVSFRRGHYPGKEPKGMAFAVFVGLKQGDAKLVGRGIRVNSVRTAVPRQG